MSDIERIDRSWRRQTVLVERFGGPPMRVTEYVHREVSDPALRDIEAMRRVFRGALSDTPPDVWQKWPSDSDDSEDLTGYHS